MNKLIAAILLSITALSASADEIAAYGLHIGSKHFPQYNYNNANPGAYIRMTSGMTYGVYYNSERRVSAYAGYTYQLNDTFAVTVGLVSGYSLSWEKKKARIRPMVVPSMKLGKVGDTTVRLAIMPPASRDAYAATALHLMLEW